MLPSKLQGSLEDKLHAVKHFISGQSLSLVVFKATTAELRGPKRKHLNYLANVTHEPNVSIPSLARYLMRRARHPEWPVAFKSLITIHHLICYGNEKFIQNLASSYSEGRSFIELDNYLDANSSLASQMSTFVRRYSRYLDVKISTYRSLGTDFCRINSSRGDVHNNKLPFTMKHLPLEKLLTTLPILQRKLDSLLEFDATDRDLNNGIISSAFAMLYNDFVKLYITYQAAINRLLELYFTITRPRRLSELLENYKKFLIRMDKVSDFIRVLDSVGVDKSDLPNLSRAPSMSIKELETRLETLESEARRSLQLASAAASNVAKLTPIVQPIELLYDNSKGLQKANRRNRATPTLTPVTTPGQQQQAANAGFVAGLDSATIDTSNQTGSYISGGSANLDDYPYHEYRWAH